jgi:hypothetical protein
MSMIDEVKEVHSNAGKFRDEMINLAEMVVAITGRYFMGFTENHLGKFKAQGFTVVNKTDGWAAEYKITIKYKHNVIMNFHYNLISKEISLISHGYYIDSNQLHRVKEYIDYINNKIEEGRLLLSELI